MTRPQRSSRGREPRRGRRVESAALWAFVPVVALVPLWLGSLAVFWLPVRLLVDLPFRWWAGGHLVASAVLFLQPVQRHVFTRLLGTRAPSAVEQQHLDEAWGIVARAVGVPPDRFVLSVVDDDEVNAFACGGHLLVVSSFAVRELPTDELTGVLAHELAHHLGSHTFALTVGQWMSLPIVTLARLGWFLQNVAQAATTAFTQRSSFAEALGQLTAGTLRLVARLLIAGLTLTTTIGNLVGRGAEFQADRRAADLGFGVELGRALRRALAGGRGDEGPSRLRRLASSHPPLRTRAARLEAFLRRGRHPSMGRLDDR